MPWMHTLHAKGHPTICERGVAFELLSHEALPGGAMAWLRVTPAANELGTAALSDLTISETGVVERVRLRNPTRAPILVPQDLVVDGGLQTRVVERSVIVSPLTDVEVPVRCVERCRWGARDRESGTRFAARATMGTASRVRFTELKQNAMRVRRRYELEQREVWEHVSSELSRAKVASVTQSYGALLSRREARMAEVRRLDVQPPSGANGLASLRRGEPVWIEVFPSRAELCAAVPAAVADLLAAADEAPGGGLPDVEARASAVVSALRAAKLVELPPVHATLGEPFAFDAPDVAGAALLHAGRVAHVAAAVSR